MSRKPKEENNKKVRVNLSIQKKIIDDYRIFVEKKGEKVSPRVENLIKKDMNEKNEE